MVKLRRRCKCGCGGITTPGKKWIKGHNVKIRVGKDNPTYKHGLTNHKIHVTWTNMKNRCYNYHNHGYKDYGGRGIRVCIRWRNNFKAFYNWSIKNGWKDELEIDRIDNNGNYHPNNCRWVTPKVNSNNKRQYKNNTSGYTGVYFDKRRNKYYAQSTIHRKPKHLGYFDAPKEAANAIKDCKNAEIKKKNKI